MRSSKFSAASILPIRGALSLLLFLGVLGTTRAEVIIVDPGGGPGAALLEAAIVSAQDGDVILLRPGDYWQGGGANIPIDDKGLVLMPDVGVDPQRIRGLRVRDVPAASTLLVRNLILGTPDSPIGPLERLSLSNCLGGTWFEDCTINGRDGSVLLFAVNGGPGVLVTNCGSVMFRRCTVRGGDGFDSDAFSASSGGPALEIRTSRVALYNGRFQGGDAGTGVGAGLLTGGDGIDVNDVFTPNDRADVFVSGCQLVGGAEGPDSAGVAGSALLVNGREASVILQDNALIPGLPVGAGTPGQELNVLLGEVTFFNGFSTNFSTDALVMDGVTAELSFEGLPNELALVSTSFAADWLLVPEQVGVLTLFPGGLAGPFFIGALDAQGELVVPFVVPPLGGGSTISVLLQASFTNGPNMQLGPASQMTWIP